MNVGNNGASVHSVTPDLGNDRDRTCDDVTTNFRNGGIGACDIMAEGGDDGFGV